MSKTTKIGLIIFAILLVILIISIIISPKDKFNNSEAEKICGQACIDNGNGEWRLNMETFYSKEECFARCKNIIKK